MSSGSIISSVVYSVASSVASQACSSIASSSAYKSASNVASNVAASVGFNEWTSGTRFVAGLAGVGVTLASVHMMISWIDTLVMRAKFPKRSGHSYTHSSESTNDNTVQNPTPSSVDPSHHNITLLITTSVDGQGNLGVKSYPSVSGIGLSPKEALDVVEAVKQSYYRHNGTKKEGFIQDSMAHAVMSVVPRCTEVDWLPASLHS